jgi:hypothetical protein
MRLSAAKQTLFLFEPENTFFCQHEVMEVATYLRNLVTVSAVVEMCGTGKNRFESEIFSTLLPLALLSVKNKNGDLKEAQREHSVCFGSRKQTLRDFFDT